MKLSPSENLLHFYRLGEMTERENLRKCVRLLVLQIRPHDQSHPRRFPSIGCSSIYFSDVTFWSQWSLGELNSVPDNYNSIWLVYIASRNADLFHQRQPSLILLHTADDGTRNAVLSSWTYPFRWRDSSKCNYCLSNSRGSFEPMHSVSPFEPKQVCILID